jgi:hypothetical protein
LKTDRKVVFVDGIDPIAQGFSKDNIEKKRFLSTVSAGRISQLKKI